jgi:transposase-like protein
MLHKGADHTTIAMHDQPVRKPLSSSVNRVTGCARAVPFFAFAPGIRKMISTTNAVEALRAQYGARDAQASAA